jgi:hypothetical protein
MQKQERLPLARGGVMEIVEVGNQFYTCPDCGYRCMPYPPKDYNICPKCKVEFGLDDKATRQELFPSDANRIGRQDQMLGSKLINYVNELWSSTAICIRPTDDGEKCVQCRERERLIEKLVAILYDENPGFLEALDADLFRRIVMIDDIAVIRGTRAALKAADGQ